jgi:U3 small nucleolar ribonucleoprotein protein LCP5
VHGQRSSIAIFQAKPIFLKMKLNDSCVNDNRLASTSELTYPSGISLLSLKNHLLLSYLHHLVALFAIKLNSKSISTSSGAEVVQGLVKLRVVLEKIGPLEGKLKYQIEKLVRKADQAVDGGNEEDVINGSFAVPIDVLDNADVNDNDDNDRSVIFPTKSFKSRRRR